MSTVDALAVRKYLTRRSIVNLMTHNACPSVRTGFGAPCRADPLSQAYSHIQTKECLQMEEKSGTNREDGSQGHSDPAEQAQILRSK